MATAAKADVPTFIRSGGIPGSGKSSFYNSRTWKPHVFVQFDGIMEEISGYKSMVEKEGGAVAFNKYEKIARTIGYELFEQALLSKSNIFFDSGGMSKEHLDLAVGIKNFGYRTEMHFIKCDLDVALQRSKLREYNTGRHLPEAQLIRGIERQDDLINGFIRRINKFNLWNNSGRKPILEKQYINGKPFSLSLPNNFLQSR